MKSWLGKMFENENKYLEKEHEKYLNDPIYFIKKYVKTVPPFQFHNKKKLVRCVHWQICPIKKCSHIALHKCKKNKNLLCHYSEKQSCVEITPELSTKCKSSDCDCSNNKDLVNEINTRVKTLRNASRIMAEQLDAIMDMISKMGDDNRG